MASSLGIYEIKQQGQTLLLYKNDIDMKQLSPLIGRMRSRVMISAGSKPYISIRLPQDAAPLDTLNDALRAMSSGAA
jgi:transcription-repair coupling factor (superfamily II helicase)